MGEDDDACVSSTYMIAMSFTGDNACRTPAWMRPGVGSSDLPVGSSRGRFPGRAQQRRRIVATRPRWASAQARVVRDKCLKADPNGAGSRRSSPDATWFVGAGWRLTILPKSRISSTRRSRMQAGLAEAADPDVPARRAREPYRAVATWREVPGIPGHRVRCSSAIHRHPNGVVSVVQRPRIFRRLRLGGPVESSPQRRGSRRLTKGATASSLPGSLMMGRCPR
jgi:hypothetical protein